MLLGMYKIIKKNQFSPFIQSQYMGTIGLLLLYSSHVFLHLHTPHVVKYSSSSQ